MAFASILESRVLIVMTIKTEQFPVAAVRGIVVMVVVLMVNREFPQIFAAEFAAATCTNPGVQL